MNGSRKGEVRSNGEVGKNGSRIGEVRSNGEVWINGSRIGEVRSNGEVWKNGSRIGEARNMSNARKVAIIYFYDFYDYPKCFDCLTQALDIANEAGIDDANIYLGFGCMYQTISEECNNYELGTVPLD